MTRSLYILGGAGAGKSTFMGQLVEKFAMTFDDLESLHTERNARGNPVTLRGHRVQSYDGQDGLYIGCMREQYPGTDGLDRASSLPGKIWLETEELPEFIIAEGATLSTRPFLTALHENTDLLLVLLHAESWVTELRFLQRGSNQNPSWVHNTNTRSVNLLNDLTKQGARGAIVDSADPAAWALALAASLSHLRGTD
jgi:hypothetical protein